MAVMKVMSVHDVAVVDADGMCLRMSAMTMPTLTGADAVTMRIGMMVPVAVMTVGRTLMVRMLSRMKAGVAVKDSSTSSTRAPSPVSRRRGTPLGARRSDDGPLRRWLLLEVCGRFVLDLDIGETSCRIRGHLPCHYIRRRH